MTARPSQLQQDVAHAMNLFAHPMAGWAAASALGFGLATQAWGLWFGAVAGAMENTLRLGDDALHAGGKAETVAAVKARAAAVSLMAEAQSYAREVAEPRPSVPEAKSPEAKPAKRRAAAKPAAGQAAPGRPAAVARPRRPDDLKAIPGIGPKLEQVLNGLGIWTYRQVAAWSEADIAWIEDQLGLSGRVSRDGWVAQAAELARPRRR